VPGGQEELIAGNAAHGFRMPAAQGGTPSVDCPGIGDVAPDYMLERATQAKIGVFEIGFEGFLEQSNAAENFSAVEHGGPRRRSNVAWFFEVRSILVSSATSPSGGAATSQIEGPIEQT
jgi:hypothetical protein